MKYFYINKENVQVGPIGIEELKAQNIEPATMVWKEDTEDWQEAKHFKELKSFFVVPPPILTPPPIKRNASVEEKIKKHSMWSPKGRMRRSEFFLNCLVINLGIYGLTYLIENNYQYPMLNLLGVLILPLFYLLIICVIRRLHDMSFSGWFFFLAFLPLINLFLIFWDGNKGTNRFGFDSKGRTVK